MDNSVSNSVENTVISVTQMCNMVARVSAVWKYNLSSLYITAFDYLNQSGGVPIGIATKTPINDPKLLENASQFIISSKQIVHNITQRMTNSITKFSFPSITSTILPALVNDMSILSTMLVELTRVQEMMKSVSKIINDVKVCADTAAAGAMAALGSDVLADTLDQIIKWTPISNCPEVLLKQYKVFLIEFKILLRNLVPRANNALDENLVLLLANMRLGDVVAAINTFKTASQAGNFGTILPTCTGAHNEAFILSLAESHAKFKLYAPSTTTEPFLLKTYNTIDGSSLLNVRTYLEVGKVVSAFNLGASGKNYAGKNNTRALKRQVLTEISKDFPFEPKSINHELYGAKVEIGPNKLKISPNNYDGDTMSMEYEGSSFNKIKDNCFNSYGKLQRMFGNGYGDENTTSKEEFSMLFGGKRKIKQDNTINTNKATREYGKKVELAEKIEDKIINANMFYNKLPTSISGFGSEMDLSLDDPDFKNYMGMRIDHSTGSSSDYVNNLITHNVHAYKFLDGIEKIKKLKAGAPPPPPTVDKVTNPPSINKDNIPDTEIHYKFLAFATLVSSKIEQTLQSLRNDNESIMPKLSEIYNTDVINFIAASQIALGSYRHYKVITKNDLDLLDFSLASILRVAEDDTDKLQPLITPFVILFRKLAKFIRELLLLLTAETKLSKRYFITSMLNQEILNKILLANAICNPDSPFIANVSANIVKINDFEDGAINWPKIIKKNPSDQFSLLIDETCLPVGTHSVLNTRLREIINVEKTVNDMKLRELGVQGTPDWLPAKITDLFSRIVLNVSTITRFDAGGSVRDLFSVNRRMNGVKVDSFPLEFGFNFPPTQQYEGFTTSEGVAAAPPFGFLGSAGSTIIDLFSLYAARNTCLFTLGNEEDSFYPSLYMSARDIDGDLVLNRRFTLPALGIRNHDTYGSLRGLPNFLPGDYANEYRKSPNDSTYRHPPKSMIWLENADFWDQDAGLLTFKTNRVEVVNKLYDVDGAGETKRYGANPFPAANPVDLFQMIAYPIEFNSLCVLDFVNPNLNNVTNAMQATPKSRTTPEAWHLCSYGPQQTGSLPAREFFKEVNGGTMANARAIDLLPLYRDIIINGDQFATVPIFKFTTDYKNHISFRVRNSPIDGCAKRTYLIPQRSIIPNTGLGFTLLKSPLVFYNICDACSNFEMRFNKLTTSPVFTDPAMTPAQLSALVEGEFDLKPLFDQITARNKIITDNLALLDTKANIRVSAVLDSEQNITFVENLLKITSNLNKKIPCSLVTIAPSGFGKSVSLFGDAGKGIDGFIKTIFKSFTDNIAVNVSCSFYKCFPIDLLDFQIKTFGANNVQFEIGDVPNMGVFGYSEDITKQKKLFTDLTLQDMSNLQGNSLILTQYIDFLKIHYGLISPTVNNNASSRAGTSITFLDKKKKTTFQLIDLAGYEDLHYLLAQSPDGFSAFPNKLNGAPRVANVVNGHLETEAKQPLPPNFFKTPDRVDINPSLLGRVTNRQILGEILGFFYTPIAQLFSRFSNQVPDPIKLMTLNTAMLGERNNLLLHKFAIKNYYTTHKLLQHEYSQTDNMKYAEFPAVTWPSASPCVAIPDLDNAISEKAMAYYVFGGYGSSTRDPAGRGAVPPVDPGGSWGVRLIPPEVLSPNTILYKLADSTVYDLNPTFGAGQRLDAFTSPEWTARFEKVVNSDEFWNTIAVEGATHNIRVKGTVTGTTVKSKISDLFDKKLIQALVKHGKAQGVPLGFFNWINQPIYGALCMDRNNADEYYLKYSYAGYHEVTPLETSTNSGNILTGDLFTIDRNYAREVTVQFANTSFKTVPRPLWTGFQSQNGHMGANYSNYILFCSIIMQYTFMVHIHENATQPISPDIIRAYASNAYYMAKTPNRSNEENQYDWGMNKVLESVWINSLMGYVVESSHKNPNAANLDNTVMTTNRRFSSLVIDSLFFNADIVDPNGPTQIADTIDLVNGVPFQYSGNWITSRIIFPEDLMGQPYPETRVSSYCLTKVKLLRSLTSLSSFFDNIYDLEPIDAGDTQDRRYPYKYSYMNSRIINTETMSKILCTGDLSTYQNSTKFLYTPDNLMQLSYFIFSNEPVRKLVNNAQSVIQLAKLSGGIKANI